MYVPTRPLAPEWSGSSLHIIERGHPDYAVARLNRNGALNFQPGAIVYAFDETDVVGALTYANEKRLPVSVRSGGHDYEGFSLINDGVVIDLSRFSAMEIELDRNLCRVGPGTLLRTLYRRLFNEGRASLPGGTCGTVAVSGITLGGGFGPLGRAHGLLCDRLRGVRLIDADGRSRVSDTDDDLLWACRGGGGGNFGIVTEFLFDTVPVTDNVTTFSVKFPWSGEAVRSALESFTSLGPALPREISATLVVTSRSWNVVHFWGQSSMTEDQTRTELRGIAGSLPEALVVDSVPFLRQIEMEGGAEYGATCWKMASTFLESPLSSGGCGAVIAALENAPASTLMQFDLLGGALADVEPMATAYWHRDKSVMIQMQSYWADPAQGQPERAWIRDAFASVDPHTAGGSYRNYCDMQLADWPERYYGGNYSRLQSIKKQYDQRDRFSYPQSIRPGIDR